MTTQPTTAVSEVVRASAEGDRRAQRELFRLCRGTVERVVWRMLGPGAGDRLELTMQDAFIRIFNSLKSYKGQSSFDTWVYRITTIACMTTIRDRYRMRERAIVRDVDVDLRADTADSAPDALAQRRQAQKALYSALGQIDCKRRAAFVLVDVDGRSLEEAAQVLACPLGTLKSRLSRARDDLARILGPVLDGYRGEA